MPVWLFGSLWFQPIFAAKDISRTHFAVPDLFAAVEHTQSIHHACRSSVVGMAHSYDLWRRETFEGECGHARRSLAGKTLAPEVGMKTPADFERVRPYAFKFSRAFCFAAGVLDTTSSSYATTGRLDKSPPTGVPCSPAALNDSYTRLSLVASLGLTADVTHDLDVAIHRAEAVEMLKGNRFQAHARCI